jgi:HEPN domain-containing protein
MATPVDLARGWMKKGDSDRLNVNRTTQTTGPYDTACFHAQQAAEKYLKAVLALAGSPILRSQAAQQDMHC